MAPLSHLKQYIWVPLTLSCSMSFWCHSVYLSKVTYVMLCCVVLCCVVVCCGVLCCGVVWCGVVWFCDVM